MIIMKISLNKLFVFSLFAMAVKIAHSASALPTGEKIIHGGALITSTPNTLFISSNTERNVISWKDFSVAKDNSVVFSGRNATYLNIVKGSSASVIDGNVKTIDNNNIYLINPNGISVGITGALSGKNIILSTSKLSAENVENFIDTGDFEFTKKGMGKVKLIGSVEADNTIIDGSQIIIRDISDIKVSTSILDNVKPIKNSLSVHSSIKRIDIGSSKKIDLEKELGLTKEDGLYDHTDKTAVSTREEFLKIASDPTGKYFITNDIDLGTINTAVTGTDEFSGAIDGAFNSITFNLAGNGHDLNQNIGLFSTLNGSSIENLKIKNANISVSSPENNTYIGGLAGVIKASSLKNVEIDGLNLTFSNIGNRKIYAGGLAGLASYEGVSTKFENVTAGFNSKTQTHLFSRDNYVFGSVLGELKDEIKLKGVNFGKTDFSDDYDLGIISSIGYSQAAANLDKEYQHNSENFILSDGYYQNVGFFAPYFIDSDRVFVTDTFNKVYSYDDLVGNSKYFNLNDYVDLNYQYSSGIQKEGTYCHDYSSKRGGQKFYFVKDGKKTETATHIISLEGKTEKPKLDDSYDFGFIADEEPDPEMGRTDESDLSFDNSFMNDELPDEEMEKAPEDDKDFDSEFITDEIPDEEMGKAPEDDNDFDSEFITDEIPDEEMGKAPEDDKDFDSEFITDEIPDKEMGKAPEDDKNFDSKFNVDASSNTEETDPDNNSNFEQPEKKQKTVSEIIANKKVVFTPIKRNTNLSFQNRYSVVNEIISKSLLASLSLQEDPNKQLADNTNTGEKTEEIS